MPVVWILVTILSVIAKKQILWILSSLARSVSVKVSQLNVYIPFKQIDLIVLNWT